MGPAAGIFFSLDLHLKPQRTVISRPGSFSAPHRKKNSQKWWKNIKSDLISNVWKVLKNHCSITTANGSSHLQLSIWDCASSPLSGMRGGTSPLHYRQTCVSVSICSGPSSELSKEHVTQTVLPKVVQPIPPNGALSILTLPPSPPSPCKLQTGTLSSRALMTSTFFTQNHGWRSLFPFFSNFIFFFTIWLPRRPLQELSSTPWCRVVGRLLSHQQSSVVFFSIPH